MADPDRDRTEPTEPPAPTEPAPPTPPAAEQPLAGPDDVTQQVPTQQTSTQQIPAQETPASPPSPAAPPTPAEPPAAPPTPAEPPAAPRTQEIPESGYQQPGAGSGAPTNQPPPQYQSWENQAAQYDTPQYQQPPYQAPQYETPQYGTPQYGTQYQAPQHETPAYGTPPYGTPPFEQGGYGAAAYQGGYPMQPGYGYSAPQTESLAVWGLVVAILAWVACPIPFVPAIVALVLAGNAQRNIEASGGAKEGRGINTATKIIAWINIGFWALVAIFVVVAIVASAAANA